MPESGWGGGRVMDAREKTPERKRIVKIWKPIQGSDLRSGGGAWEGY